MKTAYFTIINPAAGGERCGRRAPEALARLRSAGIELECVTTHDAGDATRLAREALATGYRKFLGVGGDGTSYEIVNGLFPNSLETNDRLTLASLPVGTGNSFLRDFNIRDERGAMRALERGRAQSIDVVRAAHSDGEIHYINLLSIGFSADVGALTNRRFKPLGMAGYGLAVVTRVAALSHTAFPMRVDGDTAVDQRPCVFLSFSNSQFTGGAMQMAPGASVSDGKLDIIRAGAFSRSGLLATFPKIYQGTHVHSPLIEHRRARRVDFVDLPKLDVMVDGEVLTLALRSLEVLPSALEVVS